jgi:hypothetical protein
MKRAEAAALLPSPLRGGVGGGGPHMQVNMIESHQRQYCTLHVCRSRAVAIVVLSEIQCALTPTPDLESSKLDSTPQGGGERAADAVNSRISSAIALRASRVGKG